MVKEILTRCGYRCDQCLGYKDNIQKEDKRELLFKNQILKNYFILSVSQNYS